MFQEHSKGHDYVCLRALNYNAPEVMICQKLQYFGLQIILICQKSNTLEMQHILELKQIGIAKLLHKKFQCISNSDMSCYTHISTCNTSKFETNNNLSESLIHWNCNIT